MLLYTMTSLSIFPPVGCKKLFEPLLTFFSGSVQFIGKYLIIIPHDNRLAYAHGRGPHIAGWPQHQVCQGVIRGVVLGKIDAGDFFAFGCHETLCLTAHGERFHTPQLFTRGHRFLH